MTGGATHYEVLGIHRDADADEVRRAYRAAARDVHPDAGGDADRFRRLAEARDTLLDPTRRRAYDATLPPAPARSPGLGHVQEPAPRPDAPPGTGVGEEGGGWRGTSGDYGGDVEFPAWLRGVTDAVWEASGTERGGPAVEEVPLTVAWRWDGPVSGRPVAAAADVLVPAGDAVVRLDSVSGAIRWVAGLAAPVAVPPVEVATARGAVVVVWTADERVHGLDPRRGITLWERSVALPAAPVTASATLALLPRADRRLEALDPATGEERWTAHLAGVPTAVDVADVVALALSDDTAEAVDLRRGRHRWRERLPISFDFPPVHVAGTVLLSAASGTLCGIDPATGALRGGWDVGSAIAGVATDGQRLLVTAAGPPRLLGLSPRGRLHWSTDLDEIDPEPAVAGRWGYLIGRSGRLAVADLAVGGLRATAQTGVEPVGPPVAVSAGGTTRLVVRDVRGRLLAVVAP